MRRFCLALVLLAAACSSAPLPTIATSDQAVRPNDQQDAFALSIEIGRWGAMMSEVRDLTGVRDAAGEDAAQSDDRESPGALMQALRAGVADYNSGRAQLCAARKFTASSCGAPYQPTWTHQTAPPSLADIQSRSVDLGDQVMPLWDLVCEDAARRATDGRSRMEICPME